MALASCDNCGEITITEPTPEDSQWLVYGAGDTVKFKNLSVDGDTVTYFRTGIYVQSLPGDGYSVTDDCIEQRNTQLTNIIEDQQRQLPFMATYILKKPDSLIIKVGIGTNVAWEISPNDDPTEEVSVGDKKFNAYVLEGSTTNANDPKTVYFNKEKGFLMVELNNGNRFELIDIFNRK